MGFRVRRDFRVRLVRQAVAIDTGRGWRTVRALVRRRWQRILLLLLGIVAAAALFWLVFDPLTHWATPEKGLEPKDLADARTATRQLLLAFLAGLAAVIGLGFTGRTFFLSRRGQLTDRYGKAITQLGSDKLTERLGGVYALEHLMLESERDHETVIAVLAAFIRERCPIPNATTSVGPIGAEQLPHSSQPPFDAARPSTDVLAALTVLGRRPQRAERNPVDLTGANLIGANLLGLNLTGIDLTRADLTRADLSHASMSGTKLARTNLVHANLTEADLRHADLRHADLSHASMSGAKLAHANLVHANLTEADLIGTNLTHAQLIYAELYRTKLYGADLNAATLYGTNLIDTWVDADQLATAFLDESTQLSFEVRRALRAL